MKDRYLAQGTSSLRTHQCYGYHCMQRNEIACKEAGRLQSACKCSRKHLRHFNDGFLLHQSHLSMIRHQTRISKAAVVANFTSTDELNLNSWLCVGLALSRAQVFAYCLLGCILIFAINPGDAQGIQNLPNLTPEFRHATGK